MAIEQTRFIAEDCERVYAQSGGNLEGLANSTLLVTGGAGFLGSWISELIHYMNCARNMGIRVYLLDRDRERYAARLPHTLASGTVEFIRCDVRSVTDLPRDVNFVIHGAATPDTRFHSSNPVDTMTTIADGTAAVLRAANRVSNLIKFVNISSSSVYSQRNSSKISETGEGLPLGLQVCNAYSEAKRYGEVLCSAARSEARIPVVTLRPFTFCGAYQELDSPWALNNFISDAMHNRSIRILGDGKTVRSYMYGADFAVWVLVMMLSAKSGQIFNVGSDKALTLEEIAHKVSAHFQPAPNVLLNTSLTGAVVNTTLVPDTEAAFAAFGLRQFTDIDAAIRRTIQWYRNQ
jgi:nucleoside-diphosphate-sugar epimerase